MTLSKRNLGIVICWLGEDRNVDQSVLLDEMMDLFLSDATVDEKVTSISIEFIPLHFIPFESQVGQGKLEEEVILCWHFSLFVNWVDGQLPCLNRDSFSMTYVILTDTAYSDD